MERANAVKRLLVVDDEPVILELVRASLQSPGVEVLTAQDGFAALQVLQETVPDLILLDFGLPGMTGEQLLEVLRLNPATSSVPVVVLTGLRQGLLVGADEVLTKPFDVLHLRGRVDFWLRN